MNSFRLAAAAAVLASSAGAAFAEEDGGGWLSGSWSLTLGASGYFAPEYEGDDKMVFRAVPLVSLGKTGTVTKFASRNDNISLGLIDNGTVRAGVAGKIIFGRDADDSDDLAGLDPVRWGGEAGLFAEVYPLDWLRVRGEVRHGIRSHDGIVGDVAVDAFQDVTPSIRVSGGPRLSFASSDYFDAYYGVSAAESAASGLGAYDPGSGMRAAGVGGAVTWQATDKITASVFGEYARLLGPAEDSTLVKERGSVDQFTVGISTTYRFDFDL
ncbi:MipA/OmpV family protein [Arvimicrobium flavum]|uniref:MipA/OmpV family protein n=1 Tax=Arvimicrobium flavum TaxID=3393320 RepID=UPI00237BDE8E|nr:MipA/OmpV family protein [Mesorhizobium shangrilense]